MGSSGIGRRFIRGLSSLRLAAREVAALLAQACPRVSLASTSLHPKCKSPSLERISLAVSVASSGPTFVRRSCRLSDLWAPARQAERPPGAGACHAFTRWPLSSWGRRGPGCFMFPRQEAWGGRGGRACPGRCFWGGKATGAAPGLHLGAGAAGRDWHGSGALRARLPSRSSLRSARSRSVRAFG